MDELRGQWVEDRRWLPQMADDRREREYANWKRAIARTLDWVVPGDVDSAG
jgi:glycerol kinase